MARVTVSSARLRSMLANRHTTVAAAADVLSTRISLSILVSRDTAVDFEDLCSLAQYFKRPWPYLLLDTEERFPHLGQDHRTYANRHAPLSSDIQLELDAASMMLDAAVDLFPDESYSVPTQRLSLEMEPPIAAATLRSWLGVSEEAQIGTTDEYAALRLWVEALHRRCVYVSQRRLRGGTIRAFSAVRKDQAVIVVDTGDPPYARIFSLLHEYCHLALRSAGLCDLDQASAVERYCNNVTARILIPDRLLHDAFAESPFTGVGAQDDASLQRLSRRLRVSQAVLLIRLREASLITEDVFSQMEMRRRSRTTTSTSSGGDYYATAINRVGRRFAQNVFGALSDGRVNEADTAVLLGIGEHLVSAYRDRLLAVPSASR